MKKRVSFNLKEHDIQLLRYASKVLDEDMSRLVGEAITYKFHWLDKAMCDEYNTEHVFDGKKLTPSYTKKGSKS